ncbi:MAG: hypothetical protein GY760_19685 [Deltaproteobacteria bacterium]|nr:hypothetical protein [Deltaproteobacteria bacterium]
MKKIILIALVAVLCVGTAYASKFEVTGSAFYRGSVKHNYNLNNETASTPLMKTSYYDFDMNIFPKFVVDENNFAIAKFAIRDMTAGVDMAADGTDAHSDDNLSVERAYFQTKIGPAALQLGLMDGGAWGTAFGDYITAVWRVKAVITTPIGSVVAVHQKNDEVSSETAGGNSDDNAIYYLGLVTKAGPMYIKPLLVFADYGTSAFGAGNDMDKKAILLAGNGAFGDINVEFELGWADVEFDHATYKQANHSVMGAYLDVNMKSGDNLFGATLAWGDTEKDDLNWVALGQTANKGYHGYSFGDELNFGEIIGVDMELGDNGVDAEAGMSGMTVVKLYADFKVMENLTISPMFVYAKSNYDKGSGAVTYGAATNIEAAMELDVVGAYTINDAVTYTVGLAYAQFEEEEATPTVKDPDDAWKLWHKMAISF